MEIDIKWISNEYVDMTVSVGNHRLDVGMLDKKERKELAEKLKEAADELLDE